MDREFERRWERKKKEAEEAKQREIDERRKQRITTFSFTFSWNFVAAFFKDISDPIRYSNGTYTVDLWLRV